MPFPVEPQNPAALSRLARALAPPLAPIPTGAAPRGAPLAGIRAVLFDIYGTLVISGSGDVGTATATDNAAALTAALADAGFAGDLKTAGARGVAQLDTAVRAFHAEGKADGTAYPEVAIRELWQTVVGALREAGCLAGGPASREAIEALALGYECRVNPTGPMPGAAEILAALRPRVTLGIVSNAQFYTPVLLTTYFGASLSALGFAPELCSWSWQCGEAKPSRAIFAPPLHALRERGIAPDEVLYVGNDRRNDIWTAARAGCRTALFAGDGRSLRLRQDDPRLDGVEPDLVLTELPQLLDWI